MKKNSYASNKTGGSKIDRLTEGMIRTEEDLKSANICVDSLIPDVSGRRTMTDEEAEQASVAVLESLGKCVDDISRSMDFIITHPEHSHGDFHELCMKNYDRCESIYAKLRGSDRAENKHQHACEHKCVPDKECTCRKTPVSTIKARWLGSLK